MTLNGHARLLGRISRMIGTLSTINGAVGLGE